MVRGSIILKAQEIDPLDLLPSQSWLLGAPTLRVDLTGQVLGAASKAANLGG